MLLSSEIQSFAAIALFTVNVVAQTCNNPEFIVCTAPDSNVQPLPGTSGSDISDPTVFNFASLDSVASLPIGKRHLLPRQTNDNAVCCNPDVDCLVYQNIPFCYDEATTEFLLPDGSFGFINNSTYYASDGTFVDYSSGYYSSADGSTGTFAPATATGGAAATSGLFSVEAVASNTASAPDGPIQTGGNKAVNGQQSKTTGGGATAASGNSGTSGTGSASQAGGKSQAAPGSLGAAVSWLAFTMVTVSVGVFYLL